jgi:hypothetical protein
VARLHKARRQKARVAGAAKDQDVRSCHVHS